MKKLHEKLRWNKKSQLAVNLVSYRKTAQELIDEVQNE